MPLHKSVLGFAGSLIPGLQTVTEGVGLVRGLVGSTGRMKIKKPARKTIPRELSARISPGSEGSKRLGREVKFGFTGLAGTGRVTDARSKGLGGRIGETVEEFFTGGNGNGAGSCPEPLILSPQGNCVAPTSPRGAELFAQQPIAGQFGAGFIPGSRLVDVAQCGKKQVLGSDGICYGKKQINNSDRMWPKGRSPLLTGGDLRAITVAASAGKKVERQVKRLQGLGMMKKPTARRAAPHQHAKPVPAVSV